MLCSYPPFYRKISCLAFIMGETGGSKRNLGFDELAKSREIVGDSRTNYGLDFSHVPEEESGLEMGEFTPIKALGIC